MFQHILFDGAQYWGKDADSFRPERWVEFDKGKHLKKIPEYLCPFFWGGPRLCLGNQMARFEVKIFAKILLDSGLRVRVDDSFSPGFTTAPVMFYRCISFRDVCHTLHRL